MICMLSSLLIHGTSVKEISIQVDVSKRGFPCCRIVGLPHRSIAESRERIKSAILNSGLIFPRCRTTINLSPADIPKQGAQFDVAIAIALMCAQGYIPEQKLQGALFIGELSLNGVLLRVQGLQAMVMYAQKKGYTTIYYPKSQISECESIENIRCIPVACFLDLVHHLRGIKRLESIKIQKREETIIDNPKIDFKNIIGQEKAKRALFVAAVGRHHVIMKGPPGIGKTLLAQAMHFIVPRPKNNERSKIHALQSAIGVSAPSDDRSFVAPLPTVTLQSFFGNQDRGVIGSITKAYGGILFMDELPEFRKDVISSLKHILDTGSVKSSNIQLVAAYNPCPCGNYGHPTKKCTCSLKDISRYQGKISDAVLDRIDVHIMLQDVEYSQINREGESSLTMSMRSHKAWEFAQERFSRLNIHSNAYIPAQVVTQVCSIDQRSKVFLESEMIKYGFSMRVYHSILRVARTIADIDSSKTLSFEHIQEALTMRGLKEKDHYAASHIAF